jgi:hypothetical protein
MIWAVDVGDFVFYKILPEFTRTGINSIDIIETAIIETSPSASFHYPYL